MEVRFENLTGDNCIVPGYNNKKHIMAEKRIKKLEIRRKKLREAQNGNLRFYENKNNNDHDRNLALKAFDEQEEIIKDIDKEISSLKENIENGEFNIGIGYNEDPYVPSELGFSFGNTNGRQYIGRKLERMPLDSYDENIIASEYVEGVIPETNIQDVLRLIKTEEENSIMFDSDIVFGTALLDDDITVSKAIPHIHDVMMINAENKKVCEILRGVKDPLPLSAHALQESINANLSGKGKSKAVIYTNKDGFALLDIDDANGRPLVTRNQDGKFVYKSKYIIEELANEILPNNEDNSSPVIIGDMSIVKFFVMRDDSMIKDEFLEFKVHDRNLKREIIALASTSDSAYIHGNIS